jgi:hypothetical protein
MPAAIDRDDYTAGRIVKSRYASSHSQPRLCPEPHALQKRRQEWCQWQQGEVLGVVRTGQELAPLSRSAVPAMHEIFGAYKMLTQKFCLAKYESSTF